MPASMRPIDTETATRMTFSSGDRVRAALQGVVSASADVQHVMAHHMDAMTSSWTSVTADAEALEAQRAALLAVVTEYREKLDRFRSAFHTYRSLWSGHAGEGEDAALRELGGAVVRPSANGWAVADDVVRRLQREMHAAQHAAAEASSRLFSGRQRESAHASAERVERIVLALDAHARRLSEERAAKLTERDTEAEALRRTAEAELAEARRKLGEAKRLLPPALSPWTSTSWLSWSPGLDHEHVLLGSLSPQSGKVPGKNHGFAWDVKGLPVFASVRDAVQISHRRVERATAIAMTRSLVLRALACTPPAKLRLSIFDPTGLGQSVASLLELGEYDRDLIGGKVWSSNDDLHRVLAEHTAHIELVIQKYLRAEYATLDEYNAAAGEIAEPYRLLVIFDSPAGFDERSVGELRRVIENGPRCGVATLLVTDEETPLPYGISFDDLPANLWRLRLSVPFGSVTGHPTLAFDLTPETDADAPEGVVAAIVEHVGRAARESTSTAVSFEKSFGFFSRAALAGRKRGLPRLTKAIDVADPTTWWTQSTVESVAAPVGQRGAQDVATLTFDSSDHAGALLVGRPGSGKSTLLHTFIGGITTMYGPDELELHLIDFKEGVEFKVYAANALPHARTVAIESDREFGVSVLQAIQAELTWRGSLLRGSAESHSSLESLRKTTGERLPRIVLIFDEFQVLFARNDKLGGTAAEALETLIRQGRGFGIHVLLGSQSLSGLDALGSHVPQLLPVRILLPAAENDAFRVLGEGNPEGSTLTSAGEGILNTAGGAVEANERFRGAVIDEDARRARTAIMRAKADDAGFGRRPVVFEGNAPVPAEDTQAEQFVDEIRGADARTLRLRFGVPMAIAGTADINLRREAGANVLLVARASSTEAGATDAFSVPRAIAANLLLSAVARRADVEVVDFLPIEEGLDSFAAPLLQSSAVKVSRRRQVPALLERLRAEVQRRVDEDDTSGHAIFVLLYGMHRARDFDPDFVDYDSEVDLPDVLTRILRDGPEVGVHTFMWFDSVTAISRRLPAAAVRESAWRLAGRMSADDSTSFVGVDSASSLREQQILAVNEDRGILQRCTTISEPSPTWTQQLLKLVLGDPQAPVVNPEPT